MLTELAEADATGEIAAIFADIRRLYATPYVSSIHRHMATRRGVLEWAWEAAEPAFRTGVAQEVAWSIAKAAALPPLARVQPEALAVWNVQAADVPKLKAVADSFVRVAPLNLVFGGVVRDMLRGAAASAGAASPIARATAWIPPPPLAPPPAMLDAAKLSDGQRQLLALFRSGTGSTAFVPGLYRMLAHWPAFLAHLAVELAPHFSGQEKQRLASSLLERIDAAVADIRRELPRPRRQAPSPDESAHLLSMIDGYRVTSPEMIMFGRLIRECLPD